MRKALMLTAMAVLVAAVIGLAQGTKEWTLVPSLPVSAYTFHVLDLTAKGLWGGAYITFDRTWHRLAATVTTEQIVVLDLSTGQRVASFKTKVWLPFTLPGFSPDGKFLAVTVGETVRVWEVDTGREVWTFPTRHRGLARFGPNGKLLVAPGPLPREGFVVWDLTTGHEVLFVPISGWPQDRLKGAWFSPDGRWLFSWLPDGSSVVWDATTGQVVRIFPGWVDFTPDGRLYSVVASGPGNAVVFWEGFSGPELHTLPLPSGVCALDFSPDGQILAVAAPGHTIRFVEVATGQERYRLNLESFLGIERIKEALPRVSMVAFSPDGTILAAAVHMQLEFRTLVYLWRVSELVGTQ